MKLKQSLFVVFGLVGAVSMSAITGCAVTDSAAESAFNTAMNACERQDKPDEREQCVNAAMSKYQTAIAKTRSSTASCPKSTC